MTKISSRWTLPQLSRYERLSVRMSGAAFAVSLFAAVVSPLATYYWFDTQAKDYKERGFLLADVGLVKLNYYYGNHGPSQIMLPDTTLTATLTNAGRKPIKEITVFTGTPSQDRVVPQLEVDGRLVEQVKTSSSYRAFNVVGALSPGDTITLRYRGAQTSGLTVFTEHGDRVEILSMKQVPRDEPPKTPELTSSK